MSQANFLHELVGSMSQGAAALDLNSLKPGMVVAGVVFSPVRTRFLDDAAARGCRALDGLGMLVNQGIVGIQYGTGIDPDPAVMRKALESAMGV